MNDFILSCCSSADLTEEHFNSRNISYICFHYELNGKEYEDDLGKSVPFDCSILPCKTVLPQRLRR